MTLGQNRTNWKAFRNTHLFPELTKLSPSQLSNKRTIFVFYHCCRLCAHIWRYLFVMYCFVLLCFFFFCFIYSSLKVDAHSLCVLASPTAHADRPHPQWHASAAQQQRQSTTADQKPGEVTSTLRFLSQRPDVHPLPGESSCSSAQLLLICSSAVFFRQKKKTLELWGKMLSK